MIYESGTPDPPQPFIFAPKKEMAVTGGSTRPLEGKMFPRGK
jgi:hypothetical protein